jgi:hypothetical protein
MVRTPSGILVAEALPPTTHCGLALGVGSIAASHAVVPRLHPAGAAGVRSGKIDRAVDRTMNVPPGDIHRPISRAYVPDLARCKKPGVASGTTRAADVEWPTAQSV